MEIFECENFKVLKLKLGPLSTNCYVVVDKLGYAVIVDFADCNESLIEIFKNKQLKLKYVLLTHGHFDHIMGIASGTKILNANSCVCINELDKDFLTDSVKNASFGYNFKLNLSDFNLQTFSQDSEFELNDDVKFKVISTPGHTKGSSSFLLNNEFLFTGDALFKNSVGRTDLFSGDSNQMLKTIEKFKQLGSYLKVLPGHGSLTTLAKEFECNPYF